MNRLDDIIWPECAEVPPNVEYSIICADMEAEQQRANEILSPYFPENFKKFRFSAIIDLNTNLSLFELKFTSQLSVENRLQLIIYEWIWQVVNCESKCAKLFNIKTGEILRLNSNFDDLTVIMVELLKGKYDVEPPKTDEEFLACCEDYMSSCW
jgi:hypothetical protein